MLDKNDEIKIQKIVEKTTVKVVVEALEKIILPKFDDVDKRFDNIEGRLETVEERLEIVEDTTTRTELKLNSVIKRQDSQGDQIIKINQVLKLESKVGR